MPITKKQSKWLKHLMSVKKKNPNKTLGECMVLAKKTYKR